MLPKNELLRVALNKDGRVFIDETGKAQGRGAYICSSPGCAAKLVKSKALSRAFKHEVGKGAYAETEELLRTRTVKSQDT